MTLRWQPLSTARASAPSRAAAPSPNQAPARYSASVPLTTAAAEEEASRRRREQEESRRRREQEESRRRREQEESRLVCPAGFVTADETVTVDETVTADETVTVDETVTADEPRLVCPAGATLFFSTRLPLKLASPALRTRARRMVACYKEGFGRVVDGQYPSMAPSWITPLYPPPPPEELPTGAVAGAPKHRSITEFTPFEFTPFEELAFGSAERHDERSSTATASGEHGAHRGAQPGGDGFFRHALVQRDTNAREFCVVHCVCLDHLEEQEVVDETVTADETATVDETVTVDETRSGGRRVERRVPLSWADSQAFLEALLAPAARPPHLVVLAWQPGDVVLFDNLSTMHSVTPTHAYGGAKGYAAVEGERRLMTRTAMQPGVQMLC